MKKNTTIQLILIVVALAALGTVLRICRHTKTGTEATTEVPVRNVILLIGDGMGLAQLSAAAEVAGQPLAIEQAHYIGLQKTHSADHRVTDSAAAATALSAGTKTYNGAIGVGPDTARLTSILEKAAAQGLSTGLIATCRITHATPAAFIAHVPHRSMEERIAADFLNTDITLFIGGGRAGFEQRADGRNLSDELKDRGYQLAYTQQELDGITSGKVAGLLADSDLPDMSGGRDPEYLRGATRKALQLLSGNDKGFFLMIEGSLIDIGGHDNDIDKVVTETLDLDRAVAQAFEFADGHPGTLVLVTADHETGGLTIPDNGTGTEYLFSTGGHTGTLVPVYAYGTGAEHFTGVMENTDIPKKIAGLLLSE